MDRESSLGHALIDDRDEMKYRSEREGPQGQIEQAPFITMSVRVVKSLATKHQWASATDKTSTHFAEHFTKLIGNNNLYQHKKIVPTML